MNKVENNWYSHGSEGSLLRRFDDESSLMVTLKDLEYAEVITNIGAQDFLRKFDSSISLNGVILNLITVSTLQNDGKERRKNDLLTLDEILSKSKNCNLTLIPNEMVSLIVLELSNDEEFLGTVNILAEIEGRLRVFSFEKDKFGDSSFDLLDESLVGDSLFSGEERFLFRKSDNQNRVDLTNL